jgi:hypothetical protein
MDGRTATGAAIAVALIGVVVFSLLDGLAAGLALLVAGVLLVVIGLVGWRDPRPAEATAGARTMETTSAVDDGVRDVASGIAIDETDDTEERAEPVSEEAPAPQRTVAEVEAVADPLGRGRTDSVLDVDRDDGDAPEAHRRASEPTMQVVDDGATGLDHVHDEPLLGHSDLVAHVRDYHHEIPTDGSTIQLRLLHERAHGAPHELPVNLKIS